MNTESYELRSYVRDKLVEHVKMWSMSSANKVMLILLNMWVR